MKKRINTDAITNELAGSVFFPSRTPEPSPQKPVEQKDSGTVIPRYHETSHDITIPSNHDTTIPVSDEDMIEAVRKAVKQIGKEPATQRLTLEEKNALRAIEFTYAQQGIMTSGNEIIRIGMNFLLKEYQQHGEPNRLTTLLTHIVNIPCNKFLA